MNMLFRLTLVAFTIGLYGCSTCLSPELFCIDIDKDLLNNKLKLSDITNIEHKITDTAMVSEIASILQDDTTGYGNWMIYYRIPDCQIASAQLVIRQDDYSIREYLIFEDATELTNAYIEVAAQVGDGTDHLEIYSNLNNDHLTVYTIKTIYSLTENDFIDETKPPVRDTLVCKYQFH